MANQDFSALPIPFTFSPSDSGEEIQFQAPVTDDSTHEDAEAFYAMIVITNFDDSTDENQFTLEGGIALVVIDDDDGMTLTYNPINSSCVIPELHLLQK